MSTTQLQELVLNRGACQPTDQEGSSRFSYRFQVADRFDAEVTYNMVAGIQHELAVTDRKRGGEPEVIPLDDYALTSGMGALSIASALEKLAKLRDIEDEIAANPEKYERLAKRRLAEEEKAERERIKAEEEAAKRRAEEAEEAARFTAQLEAQRKAEEEAEAQRRAEEAKQAQLADYAKQAAAEALQAPDSQ